MRAFRGFSRRARAVPQSHLASARNLWSNANMHQISRNMRKTRYGNNINDYRGRMAARAFSADSDAEKGSEKKYQIRLLFDGDCPLCMREVDMLRRRSDERGGTIDFVDIASPDYNPKDNNDIDFETAMTRIHGVLPDGTIVRDIEVFKVAYEAVGLGWVYAFTQVKPLRVAADWLYGIWARNRLSMTGRSDLSTILSEKKTCGGGN
uniref:Thiol-disulfide oxidoreductase DCC n=1 Tax=Lotharella oceanica TaxID=641309 RepID=A0A7S2TY63_9EUKA